MKGEEKMKMMGRVNRNSRDLYLIKIGKTKLDQFKEER